MKITGFSETTIVGLLSMANMYTQIHIQLVFAVKYRASVIHTSWKERLHQVMTGIVQKYNHKMLQVNSMPDHVHLFFGMRPTQSISDLTQIIKGETSRWIKAERFCSSSFAWQEGFGAFSYSKSHVHNVIRYIKNQEAHHQKETFLKEYHRLLKAFEIDYDERYVFREMI